jgi:hypothetical protein
MVDLIGAVLRFPVSVVANEPAQSWQTLRSGLDINNPFNNAAEIVGVFDDVMELVGAVSDVVLFCKAPE